MTVTYPDTLVLPVINDALTCLCTAARLNPKPPGACCLRPYVNGTPMLGTSKDECCGGLGFVYFGPAFPAQQANSPQGVPLSCGIVWALTMQMGIWRCAPTGTLTTPPSCDDWNSISTDLADDFATLRDALCCFMDTRQQRTVSVEGWSIINDGPEGGCIGSSLTMTVQLTPKRRT